MEKVDATPITQKLVFKQSGVLVGVTDTLVVIVGVRDAVGVAQSVVVGVTDSVGVGLTERVVVSETVNDGDSVKVKDTEGVSVTVGRGGSAGGADAEYGVATICL